MGAKLNELDGLVHAARTIVTTDDFIIPSSPANRAIKIDDEEVFLHRGTVIPTEIPFQRFPQSDGIGKNHVYLSLDRIPQGRVLF
jgi:hypothetical protein